MSKREEHMLKKKNLIVEIDPNFAKILDHSQNVSGKVHSI